MRSDKEMKVWFKKEASEHPEKYYPVEELKKLGFMRKHCPKTKIYFWTTHPNRECSGEPEVQGGFTFIGNSPAKQPISYEEVWPKFAAFFEQRGYKPLARKPVVARWRDDVYWVAASVYPFQPYVVRGETKPPSNQVTIPQPSLRFNDIDNVGITGSHYSAFVMLGQLCFEPKEEYDAARYFLDYFSWITSEEGMGVPISELTLHEDAWAGGGTFGPSIEFFSRGMEIGNQVYMWFEQDDSAENGFRELDIRVLDMGQGMERVPWFTSGTSTSYDTTFPTVMHHLYQKTRFEKNSDMVQKFLPHAALLNVDEVQDVDAQWQTIADAIGYEVEVLRDHIEHLAALYSIADHSRAALFGLADGAVPSNVGGGYNMRMIIRRALHFIEKYNWNVDIRDLILLHARYLDGLFPELVGAVENVNRILSNEIEKFAQTRAKSKQYVERLLEKGDVSVDQLLEAYDSQGILPDTISSEGKKVGVVVSVPSDFYALVAERHAASEQKSEQKVATQRQFFLPVSGETEILYFDDYLLTEFESKVVAVGPMPAEYAPPSSFTGDRSTLGFVVLDKTAFYPTSGGQIHDTGVLNVGDATVVDVFKQDNVVVHVVNNYLPFHEGQTVAGAIDKQRRIQISQHHTSAHIINAAARTVLGDHINQAGAAKDERKARLDITHFENLSETQLIRIEQEANKIVQEDLGVRSEIVPREVAEANYSVRIYQGGFIPGRNLRIVHVGNQDIQACGGTHVRSTSQVGSIKVVGSSRVQDGVVRIHFLAGNAAKKHASSGSDLIAQIAEALGVEKQFIPSRCAQLFFVWKKAKKAVKKGNVDASIFIFAQDNAFSGDVLAEAARVLKTQPEHVLKTVQRFLKEIEEAKVALGQH